MVALTGVARVRFCTAFSVSVSGLVASVALVINRRSKKKKPHRSIHASYAIVYLGKEFYEGTRSGHPESGSSMGDPQLLESSYVRSTEYAKDGVGGGQWSHAMYGVCTVVHSYVGSGRVSLSVSFVCSPEN